MRFFANGPLVPDDLIHARARGNVVFFCGAGVSVDAGQPDFKKLARDTMDLLQLSPSSQAEILMEQGASLDRVFSVLQRDFGADRVDREVVAQLRLKLGAFTGHHETILKLSADADGNPLVVTTNYDLLFERARKRLARHTPPNLPDFSKGRAPTGIVYLHGRLPTRPPERGADRAMVLSSGDFGRAYLAEGWATQFMRQLLEERSVVLVGYTADDPPVRYLLEGLLAGGVSSRKTIYAFARGTPEAVETRWSEIGVKGIGFETFPDLWQTLKAWSATADLRDPSRDPRLDLARRSPRTLEAFERGQVAALVNTVDGAKAFLQLDPPAPAEWLCVFDMHIRTAPMQNLWGVGPHEFNPMDVYGLDIDEPRNPGETEYKPLFPPMDLISKNGEDHRWQKARLGGQPESNIKLPARLHYLAYWLQKVSDQPAAIWWAARQVSLHPRLIDAIRERLDRPNGFQPELRRLWSLMLESFDNVLEGDGQRSWYQYTAKYAAEGWSPSVRRHLEDVMRPHLGLHSHGFHTLLDALQPSGETAPPPPSSLFRFELTAGARYDDPIITDENRHDVLKILRKTLLFAVDLTSEDLVGIFSFSIPPQGPDDGADEGIAKDFYLYWEVFKAVVASSREEGLVEIRRWPRHEPKIFDLFRVKALCLPDVLPPSEACAAIGNLARESFWSYDLERDLLPAIRDYWPLWTGDERSQVEELILAGPDTEGVQGSPLSLQIGLRLAWLELNGVIISAPSKQILASQRATAGWHEEWIEGLTGDGLRRAGRFNRETDPGPLALASYAEMDGLLETLTSRSWSTLEERIPFIGLVASKPAFALGYLIHKHRVGINPIQPWGNLLGSWPMHAGARATWLAAAYMLNLPDPAFLELRWAILDWVDKNIAKILLFRPQSFWPLWDRLYDRLQTLGAEAVGSQIGTVSQGGRILITSRKTYQHAFSSPIGKLVTMLIHHLSDGGRKSRGKIPSQISERLLKAITSVGDGADHAVTILGRSAAYLAVRDFNWAKENLAGLFSLDASTAEAAWNGFSSGLPRGNFFALIKPDFLRIFAERPTWFCDDRLTNQLTQQAVAAAYFGQKDPAYLSPTDIREVLRQVSDKNRQAAAAKVREVIRGKIGWDGFGRAFFTTMWPQELRYQTNATSYIMLGIAQGQIPRFKQVIEVLSDFLRPIGGSALHVFSRKATVRDVETNLAKAHPKTVLRLLDRLLKIEPDEYAFDLKSILDTIAAEAPDTQTSQAWRRLYKLVPD